MFSTSSVGTLEQSGTEVLCGAAQPRTKKLRSRRSVTDRSPLGARDAETQLDRGRPGIVSPNSRKSRAPRPKRSSSHSQGRDGSKMPTWIGVDVAKDTLDLAYASVAGIECRSVA